MSLVNYPEENLGKRLSTEAMICRGVHDSLEGCWMYNPHANSSKSRNIAEASKN